MASAVHIGVDTGGTFTDVVLWDGRHLRTHKVPSTPDDFARGVLHGIAGIRGPGAPAPFDLTHSATVATNALLERRGARTALITTQGFADVIEIGRQHRPALYDLAVQRPAALVPRGLRIEVRERVAADGGVLQALEPADLRRCLETLEERGVEAVAVCLLFSFLQPRHERLVARAARQFGWHVSVSSEILAEFREYERTCATVINAYVAPVMERYLKRLNKALRPLGCPSWRIMQSNGGSLSAGEAGRQALHTLLSGPAAGVGGALAVARRALGQRRGGIRIMTFDMGGTSTDVALLRDTPHITTEGSIAGYPLRIPMMDIHTVGAGGGSVADVDAGGALHVGPRSAGADPGPACYGRSDVVTVTDANLLLGRIDPQRFLGGRMSLDVTRAQRALAALARRMDMTPRRAAQAVLRVVNANMERALRVISTQRGHDPRDFTLVSFGGAGGLHACELATALRMQRVLVPRDPGVLSALGAVSADVVRDVSRTVMLPGTASAAARLPGEVARLQRRLDGHMRSGLTLEARALAMVPSVDLRYRGQSYEVNVPWLGSWPRALAAFHAAHHERYGHSDPAAAMEIVTVRVRAVLRTPTPRFQKLRRSTRLPSAARLGRRAGAEVYDRAALLAGNRLRGPLLALEPYSSTWVPASWRATVDDWGNLILEPCLSQTRKE